MISLIKECSKDKQKTKRNTQKSTQEQVKKKRSEILLKILSVIKFKLINKKCDMTKKKKMNSEICWKRKSAISAQFSKGIDKQQ